MKTMTKNKGGFTPGSAPDLAGKRVLVVGAARTGVSAAAFLARRGAAVTLTDRKEASALGLDIGRLDPSIALELGGNRQETFLSQDLIVPSPGVPMDDPLLAAARGSGIAVMSEVELAYRFLAVPLIAVTGTNGKSTTVTAVEAILTGAGIPVRLGGNIGNPLIGEVDSLASCRFAVAEISSFQLEWTESFRPWLAAILNLSEDHLDRYRSFGEYVAAKKRIFENQGPEDFLVLNADDPVLREAASGAPGRKVWFSRRGIPLFGVYLMKGWIYSRLGRGAGRKVMPVGELRIEGRHNWENAMAATAIALLAGAAPGDVRRALGRFGGLAHRTEFVREVRGVRYFDDSKATNVGAAASTLAGFRDPVILIAGGRDKGGSYAPLAPLARRSVKRLVLMGEAARAMGKELEGATSITIVDDMEAAVRAASGSAAPGDVVLLSPACSSFDLYRSYSERGLHFQREVGKL